MLFLGYDVNVLSRCVLCALWLAVGWDAREESVGFIALVRVQAVILLSTYLTL